MPNEGGAGVVEQTQASGAVSGAAAVSTGSSGSVSGASAGSGVPNPVTKWEDDPRAKGMLADLQKERKARQDFERRVVESEARAAERDRQVAALTNSRQPTTDEAEANAVRERFNQLFPHLGGLTAEDIDALKELRGQSSELQAAVKHHWTEHSKGMLAKVYEKLDATTPKQQRKITALYVAEAEANPEFLRRHDAGDKTLIDEFVKSYEEDIAEPIRRKAIASEVSRHRAVPSGGSRTLPDTGGKPIDLKDDKAVMDYIMESRKGQFKR